MRLSTQQFRSLSRTVLTTLDSFAFVFSFYLAFLLRASTNVTLHFGGIQPFGFYIPYLVFLLFFFFVTQHTYHLYTNAFLMGRMREAYLVMRSVIWWLCISGITAFVLHISFSRLLLVVWASLLFVLVVGGRLVVKSWQMYLVRKKALAIRIGLVGKEELTERMGDYIEDRQLLGLSVCFMYDYSATHMTDPQAEGDKLVTAIANSAIDEVYILDRGLPYGVILNAFMQLSDKEITFRIATDIFARVTGAVNPELIDELPELDSRRIHPPLSYRVGKRCMDILGSLIGILVTLPLSIGITIAIATTSRGPIIIRQKRVGMHKKSFTLYKFRTMYADTPLYKESPRIEHDERITSIGHLLRKTSLDELPQLLNVLLGTMSLVGPRPEMPFIVAKYAPWQYGRLLARPGITGLWQILGRKDLVLSENLEYDFYYINNRGFLFDIIILARTIPVVLFGKGAY